MLSQLKYAPEPVADLSIPDEFSVAGWVYVLANECMPGIYKIGMTANDPHTRAKEISQGTGVPAPFTVVKAYFSESPREDELAIHEQLSDYRFNPNREFFKCPLAVIEDCIFKSGLFEETSSVSLMANDYSIICFEQSKSLNLDHLFEALGITVFGSRLAIAERLIEMAIATVDKLTIKGMSLVFSEGMAVPVERESHRKIKEQIMREAKNQAETGIYGPVKPVLIPDFDDNPF